MGIINSLKKAWNLFSGKNDEVTRYQYISYGSSSSSDPSQHRLHVVNERTALNSILNRLAIDAASIDLKHVKTDATGKFAKDYDSGLNACLQVSANKDQTASAFKIDMYLSLLDQGCIAIVPVDTDVDITKTDSYDILSLRVGRILTWFPDHVEVELYNDRTGNTETVRVEKRTVAIIENPWYSIMNSTNSTLQRLNRKLSALDVLDNQTIDGKLNLILQLPYDLRSDLRKKQADVRRGDLEDQLKNSKYGIAYTSSTEKITQLNRSIENNILDQVKYLTDMLYSQLGITTSILDGTADEKTMLNYYQRTIIPLVTAITEEVNRKFLTKTAISQHQKIIYHYDAFKFVPIEKIATISDSLTRNAILSSNEVRQIIGFEPVEDPEADKLSNKNLNADQRTEESYQDTSEENTDVVDEIDRQIQELYEEGENQNG